MSKRIEHRMDYTPFHFQELPERVFEFFFNSGPYDTPEKIFMDVDSAIRAGFQIGHEMAVNYDNYVEWRPETENQLLNFFKVGLYNGMRIGFDLKNKLDEDEE